MIQYCTQKLLNIGTPYFSGKNEGGLRSKGWYKKNVNGMPLISIITVVKNDDKNIEKTILSVITQKYENIEYIIIDGESIDGTIDVIKKYENAINYWISEKDNGIYDAMNKAIALIHGKGHLFLNSGDYFVGDVIVSPPKSYPTFYKVKYVNNFGKLCDIKIKDYRMQLPNCHQGILFESKGIKYNTKYKISADLEYYYLHGYNNRHERSMSSGYIFFDNNGINSKNRKIRDFEISLIILKYHGVLRCLKFCIYAIAKDLIIILANIYKKYNKTDRIFKLLK